MGSVLWALLGGLCASPRCSCLAVLWSQLLLPRSGLLVICLLPAAVRRRPARSSKQATQACAAKQSDQTAELPRPCLRSSASAEQCHHAHGLFVDAANNPSSWRLVVHHHPRLLEGRRYLTTRIQSSRYLTTLQRLQPTRPQQKTRYLHPRACHPFHQGDRLRPIDFIRKHFTTPISS
jgi:hypothetical protein